jgi:hypothetical protein
VIAFCLAHYRNAEKLSFPVVKTRRGVESSANEKELRCTVGFEEQVQFIASYRHLVETVQEKLLGSNL